ncbi:MAG TPA: hypothetical protein VJ464_12405 [Blastocatellia bacterium]|nr:hypothetical protein [Blastocatellia bacterium]
MQLRKTFALLLMALLISSTALAASFNNPADDKAADISGKYEGIAKSEAFGEIPLTVNLKNNGGKLTGTIETPQGPANITDGSYADGKLTLKFDAGGNEGTVTATLAGEKIVGKWELGGASGTLDLKKAGGSTPAAVSTPAAPAGAPKAATGDPVSGDWEAAADAGGMTIPFTLKLKLEGDKVTGTSTSDQGTATLSNGKWDGNKLSFSLDTPQGSITMSGAVKEGQINGDFDFAGQMTGKWSAKKK